MILFCIHFFPIIVRGGFLFTYFIWISWNQIKYNEIYIKLCFMKYFTWNNSEPKIHFWTNLGQKIQSCPFCLKIGAPSNSRILIPNSELDFWILTLKSSFGQIWAQKFKVVRFVSKLVPIVSQGCWFRIQT